MRNQNLLTGFTIVEVLITVAIFILIVVVIFSIYLTSQRFYQRGEVRAELLQNGRVILERLAREIRQAEEIVTPLPQLPDNPDNPPPEEIEFQDGHIPSPYQELGSDYYYIRHYLATTTGELYRQYRVYCFDSCEICNTYFRWNDTKIVGEEIVKAHPCDLEDKIIGEYAKELKFWGSGLINISLTLFKQNEKIDMQTKILGRNL